MNEARSTSGPGAPAGSAVSNPSLQPRMVPPTNPAMRPMSPSGPGIARPMTPGATAAPAAPAAPKPANHVEEPLELVSETPTTPGAAAPASKIHQITAAGSHSTNHAWRREPHINPTGAIRVKSFHGRLSDNGLEYLDNAINEWLDRHPEIDIKFVTSTEGMFDGKIKEPALILNVWF